MGRTKTVDSDSISSDDLADALQAIAQAARAQAASAAQIMLVMQQMAQAMQPAQAGGPGTVVGTGTVPVNINIWEDDAFSEEEPTERPSTAPTIAVQVPVNNHTRLQTRITGPAVAPGSFAPGSPEFRFWIASEALARGINFWAPLLPAETQWKTVTLPMQVGLVAGVDLNAFYSRIRGLQFFQQVVRNVAIASAESADVVCHELGHAILDAIRPQLFDAASLEVDAFHEAFGDMSGILCALQVPSLRQKVLSETGGQLNTNSRISRLAEQLAWGIRQLSPTAVDRDCLRNAANRFFYQDPVSLPPTAPATGLSSEPHSFARVFTGAFLDALAEMLEVAGTDDQGLLQISRDMGRLLVNGVLTASIVPRYYSQVAAAMIQADRTLFQDRYRAALISGFVQHGILASNVTAELADAPAPRMVAAAAAGERDGIVSFGDGDDAHTRTAADAPELPTRAVRTVLGITIQVHAPDERPRFAVSSARAIGQVDRDAKESDAAAFVEDLIQTGRLEVSPARGVAGAPAINLPVTKERSLKTHTLVREDDGTIVLKRLLFDCGFHGCRHGG